MNGCYIGRRATLKSLSCTTDLLWFHFWAHRLSRILYQVLNLGIATIIHMRYPSDLRAVLVSALLGVISCCGVGPYTYIDDRKPIEVLIFQGWVCTGMARVPNNPILKTAPHKLGDMQRSWSILYNDLNTSVKVPVRQSSLTLHSIYLCD